MAIHLTQELRSKRAINAFLCATLCLSAGASGSIHPSLACLATLLRLPLRLSQPLRSFVVGCPLNSSFLFNPLFLLTFLARLSESLAWFFVGSDHGDTQQTFYTVNVRQPGSFGQLMRQSVVCLYNIS